MAKAKYTRGKDGFFRTKVWDGTYNEDGTKHRVGLSSKKSSADLEKQVINFNAAVKAGSIVRSDDILFLDYAREWFKIYKNVREIGTQNMYRNIIENHLIALEGLLLINTRKSHFQLVINNAQDHPRLCQQINITFKQIIEAACQDKLLPRHAVSDICNNIVLPKYVPEEKRALYPEEIEAIKKANFTAREKAFVYIIYGCGLRRGEVLALNKDTDIDFKQSRITVRQAVGFDGNNPYLKDPKSINGFRAVPMPPFLSNYLADYIKSLKSPYLISKNNGDLMTKSSYDKMWIGIANKMNVAAGGTKNLKVIYGFTAHTFRHNFCTNLCYQIPKISIKKIAQLMGDTEAMVIDVYNHIKEEKEDADSVVSEAMAL